MDDQSDQTLKVVKGSDLAFGIQLVQPLAGGAQLTMTTAWPVDCTDDDLRRLILRMSDAGATVTNRANLAAAREELKRWHFDLDNNRQHIANHETNFQAEWQQKGRRGELRL